ncbi:type II toxin-antitoxin system RelB/DinJ family antitoxin [Lonepinella sp. MS14437]|uniref:type II toxin-antitoxin system RelB/DinJ family antitoxin n=1 Tax=unclassified Lonepinella TaxID=2642006 RepID=UPI0036DC9C9E
MDSSITIRVDQSLKTAAQLNLQKMGLDLSSAIRMLMQHLAVKAELPAELAQPNSQTLQAIYELENNINCQKYQSVEQLKQDLGW